MSEIPMLVTKNPRGEDNWQARVGEKKVAAVAATQAEAVEAAERRAEHDHRPGTVVLKEDGQFKRFIPHNSYWTKYARLGAHSPFRP